MDGDSETLNARQLFPHHSFLTKVTSDNPTPSTLADKQYPAFYVSENPVSGDKYISSSDCLITVEEYFTFEIQWEHVYLQGIIFVDGGNYWPSEETKAKHRAAFQDDLEYIEPHLSQEETDAVFDNQSYDTWTNVNSSDHIYIELIPDAYSGESYAVSTRARTQLISAEYDYHFTRHTIVRIIRRKNLLDALPNGDITSPSVNAVDSFIFPIQDDFTIKIYQSSDNFLESTDAEILQDDNVIISQSQFPDLFDNPYDSNMSICPLTAGYLVGAHGKHLYTILVAVGKLKVDNDRSK